jgi:hypothetical protein
VVGVRAKPGAFMRSVRQATSPAAVSALGGPAGGLFGPMNHGDHDRPEEQERGPGEEKRREHHQAVGD